MSPNCLAQSHTHYDALQNISTILQQRWEHSPKDDRDRLELCWGYELGGKLDRREVPLTDIYLFKHLKVLLFPSIDVSDLEKAILEELNRMPEPRWTA